jgi:hypothetical protein
MTPADAWTKVREQYYRDLKKSRPRCKAKRKQLVTPKVMRGQPVRPAVMMNLSCGYLLDRTGRCWFCGHVDREVRRAYREARGDAE